MTESTLTDKEINEIEIKHINNDIINILTGMFIGCLLILLTIIINLIL